MIVSTEVMFAGDEVKIKRVTVKGKTIIHFITKEGNIQLTLSEAQALNLREKLEGLEGKSND